jgi:hypothetical protein
MSIKSTSDTNWLWKLIITPPRCFMKQLLLVTIALCYATYAVANDSADVADIVDRVYAKAIERATELDCTVRVLIMARNLNRHQDRVIGDIKDDRLRDSARELLKVLAERAEAVASPNAYVIYVSTDIALIIPDNPLPIKLPRHENDGQTMYSVHLSPAWLQTGDIDRALSIPSSTSEPVCSTRNSIHYRREALGDDALEEDVEKAANKFIDNHLMRARITILLLHNDRKEMLPTTRTVVLEIVADSNKWRQFDTDSCGDRGDVDNPPTPMVE